MVKTAKRDEQARKDSYEAGLKKLKNGLAGRLAAMMTTGHALGVLSSLKISSSSLSLRDAHARLMARRDEVDTAFKGIDSAAAAVPVPRPGRRVPADLAYTTP